MLGVATQWHSLTVGQTTVRTRLLSKAEPQRALHAAAPLVHCVRAQLTPEPTFGMSPSTLWTCSGRRRTPHIQPHRMMAQPHRWHDHGEGPPPQPLPSRSVCLALLAPRACETTEPS